MHLLPDSFALPFLKVVIYRRVGRQVVGQHFPLTPGALDVKNAVENFSKIYFYRMPKPFRLREQWLENFPFGIAQIARVRFSVRVGDGG